MQTVVRRAVRFWPILGVTLVLACSLTRHGINPFEDESTVVTVSIINHNLLDMTIYALRQGSRDRLGQVTAATSTSFRVRLTQLGTGGDLQLYADPIGATQGFASDRVHLFAGQTAEWTLESDLRRS